MVEVIKEKEDRVPPHHWRNSRTGEVFRWGGLSTCLCTNCGRLFTSGDAFDRHYLVDAASGRMTCYDPAVLMRKKDNAPAFERIEKPTWTPNHVWARARPQTHWKMKENENA